MNIPTILPSSTQRQAASKKAIIPQDERAVMHIIDLLVARAGISQTEIAKRMGIKPQSLNQYLNRRRLNPSIHWMTRLAGVCGGRIVLEFPSEGLDGQ